MPHQVASAWAKVIRLSLPNEVLDALGAGDVATVVRHLTAPVGPVDAAPAAA
jgi:stage V sporulation protein SpoVS